MTDFSERRPYNAVTDFVDANVARVGAATRLAFDDGARSSPSASCRRRPAGSPAGCARSA